MPYARKLLVGGKDITNLCGEITFSWSKNGCDSASFSVLTARFDDFMDIDIEDDVRIIYDADDTDSCWWHGFVVELESQLEGGLSVACVGTKELLAEVIPTGIFGTGVETTVPTGVTAVAGDADEGVDGLAGPVSYYITITSLDSIGEIWAKPAFGQSYSTNGSGIVYTTVSFIEGDTAKKITIDWTDATGPVRGYRIYICTSTTFASDDGCIAFDVIGDNTFTYDGEQTGEADDAPSTSTSLTPDIDDTDIEAVITHLLDTFLPDALSTGSIDLGDYNNDLDYYDLSEGADDMMAVLDALCALSCASAYWYVDAENTVNVSLKSETVTRGFRIYSENTVDADDSNALIAVTRTKTRDGVTDISIIGTDTLQQDTQDDAIDTSVETPASTASTMQHTTVTWLETVKVRSAFSLRFSASAMKDIMDSLTGSDILNPDVWRSFIATYATLDAWLVDFPNRPFIYNNIATLSDNWIYNWVMANYQTISVLLADQETQVAKSYDQDVGGSSYGGGGNFNVTGFRPNHIVRRYPGISTAAAAQMAASSTAVRYVPNPEVWKATVAHVTNLYKPWYRRIKIYTSVGDSYSIDINASEYTFGDIAVAVLSGGFEMYTKETEETDNRRILKKLVSQQSSPNTWR